MNDAANAVPLLDQVARADRNSSAPRFLRAILADRAHDFATADIQLAGLSSVIDDLPQGYYYLGVTKLGLGQVAQAEDAAAKYHARSPNDPAGTKLLALAELGIDQPAVAVGLVAGLVAAGHADSETLDLLGRAQAATNDWAHAAESLARAHELAPDNVEILNRLAVAEFQTGRNREAVRDLQRSLDLQPGQDQAGISLVRAALAAGDPATARDAVTRLRQAHGETPVTGMLNADILAATLDLRGAETGYRAVLQRYDETADNAAALRQTTIGLVRVLGMAGDSAGVRSTLADWVRVHPKDVDVLGMLLKLLFADGKPDQAVELAAAAHDGAPADARLTEMLARAHVAAHQLQAAETLLDRAGAATNPKLARLRAEILVMDGKRDQARTAYADVLQTSPGDSLARAEAMQLLAQANAFDQARGLGQEGLALHPGDPLVMQALVGVALKQGGLKAALAEAADLAADARNLPAAALLTTAAYAAAGDTNKAADAALAAYRQAPSAKLLAPVWSALVRAGRQTEAENLAADTAAAHPEDVEPDRLLGAAAAAEHRPAEAVRYLRAVLRQRPNDAATLNNLAWALLAQGDVDQAEENAQRAYFIEPGADSADTLGWILLRRNQASQALPLLRQAVLGKATAAVAYHYAAALGATGDKAQARALLQKLVAEQPAFDDRKDAVRLLDDVSK
jgi:putative PEP-CTERM system TPR-repeat lipoprotein